MFTYRLSQVIDQLQNAESHVAGPMPFALTMWKYNVVAHVTREGWAGPGPVGKCQGNDWWRWKLVSHVKAGGPGDLSLGLSGFPVP